MKDVKSNVITLPTNASVMLEREQMRKAGNTNEISIYNVFDFLMGTRNI